MKLIMTLSKDVADKAEAEAVFKTLKQIAAIDLDMTLTGYTTDVIPYDVQPEPPA